MNKQQLHTALDELIAKYEELTKDLEPAIMDLALVYTNTDLQMTTTKVIVNAQFYALADNTFSLEENSHTIEKWHLAMQNYSREARSF
jgi:hypothetical protein